MAWHYVAVVKELFKIKITNVLHRYLKKLTCSIVDPEQILPPSQIRPGHPFTSKHLNQNFRLIATFNVSESWNET